jgi:hypothetical protein
VVTRGVKAPALKAHFNQGDGGSSVGGGRMRHTHLLDSVAMPKFTY